MTTANNPLQCQNCKRMRRLMPRIFICRPCYDKAEVRLRFRLIYGTRNVGKRKKPQSRGRPTAKSGVDWHSMSLPPPDSATNAVPGSEHKIEVMRNRVAAGKQIFHEADLTFRLLIGQMKMALAEPFSEDDD